MKSGPLVSTHIGFGNRKGEKTREGEKKHSAVNHGNIHLSCEFFTPAARFSFGGVGNIIDGEGSWEGLKVDEEHERRRHQVDGALRRGEGGP